MLFAFKQKQRQMQAQSAPRYLLLAISGGKELASGSEEIAQQKNATADPLQLD